MSTNAYWWTALGLGLVVIVAALVLLQLLLRQVQRVERASSAILDVTGPVVTNTQSSTALVSTSQYLEALTEEAGRHDQFLREVLSSRDGG